MRRVSIAKLRNAVTRVRLNSFSARDVKPLIDFPSSWLLYWSSDSKRPATVAIPFLANSLL